MTKRRRRPPPTETVEVETRHGVEKLTDVVNIGPCFCGAALLASPSTGGLIHALPTCAKYDSTDVLAFVKELRILRGGDN